ncbi:MAG: TolC family protein [Candidatus Acidiferrales bacterium]
MKNNLVLTMVFLGTLFGAPVLAQEVPHSVNVPVQSQTETTATITADKQTQAPDGTQVLTLDKVVALALQRSPELALARARYTVAKNQVGLDRSDFHPNIYTGAGYIYTNGIPETPSGAVPSVFELAYNQEIFDPLKRGVQHADEDLAKNQDLEYQNTRDTIMAHAALDYLELAAVRHSLALLLEDQQSQQKILDVTRERAQAGLELPTTLTEDELNLAKTEQRIVVCQSRDEILSSQIREMTGLAPDTPLQVSLTEQLAAQTPDPASKVVGAATDHSVAIREAENVRSAREHEYRGAKDAYWPTISLVGEYSVLSDLNNYQQYFRAYQQNNVNVGVEITIPIFAARTSANAALAKSQLNEAELELASQKTSVRMGAEQKVRTLKEKDAGSEVARLDLELAQEQLQSMQVKFNQGQATLRDLEQLRVRENEKWLAFLDADLSRERAQVGLLQATGQLAQAFH